MQNSQVIATPKYGFQSKDAEEFPPIIVLENTTVCNLKCIHCAHGHGYTERPEYHASFMKWDLYKKIIDEISENKFSFLRMSPAGEALLHPELIDQVAYAKQKIKAPIDLTTNGLTLDEQAREGGQKIPNKTIIERLLEIGIDLIDISLDAATREKYEAIRVKSNYHRVWSNIHRLLYLREKIKSPTKLMLSIIDQPEAKGEVEKFVEYWTPLVDRVIVRPYLESIGNNPYKPGSFVDQMKEKGIQRWPCPQFWKRVTISPEGMVRFCVVDWQEKSNLADLHHTTIKEVWKNSEYSRLRGCHLGGKYGEAHNICGPCTDWMGMRWEWGFEVAVNAALGDKNAPSAPPPLAVKK
jgi:MoaA/NifB/PqqE/SkfB family radical SAM enzyme